tara:strand:+ start:393 stop:653 length:261 start_codon:yes stop_codon:yes gene_type:complete
MATHKSAKKRSRQSISKNNINAQYLSKIRTDTNKLVAAIKSKKAEEINKLFSELNSSMAKAVKRGIIKHKHISRKLSSFSNQIKNI